MFLAGVAVHVDVHDHLALLVKISDEFTHVVDLGLFFLLAGTPLPIEVAPKA